MEFISKEDVLKILSAHMAEEDKNGKILLSDVIESINELPSRNVTKELSC